MVTSDVGSEAQVKVTRTGTLGRGVSQPQSKPSLDLVALVEKSIGTTRRLWVYYKAPPELALEESSIFQLSIAGKDRDAAKTAISTSVGRFREAQVDVTDKVRATLDGDPALVTIQLIGEGEQAVTEASNTIWQWRVTPKKPGKVVLTYHVYNIVYPGEDERTVEWEAKDFPFEVLITPIQRVKLWFEVFNKTWAWLAAVVPAAIAGLAWLQNKRRSERAPLKKPKQRRSQARSSR